MQCCDYSKYNTVTDADKINFHTPELSLDNSQVIWMFRMKPARTAVPQVDLYFNYRVNPEDLKDKLKIEVEGKKADYTVVTLSPDNKISVRINGFENRRQRLMRQRSPLKKD